MQKCTSFILMSMILSIVAGLSSANAKAPKTCPYPYYCIIFKKDSSVPAGTKVTIVDTAQLQGGPIGTRSYTFITNAQPIIDYSALDVVKYHVAFQKQSIQTADNNDLTAQPVCRRSIENAAMLPGHYTIVTLSKVAGQFVCTQMLS